jgi:S1-C subfamily serine protease
MLVDLLIVLGAAAALYQGRRNGFVLQIFAAAGFFGGLFFGSWLQRHTVSLAQTTDARAIILIVTTLGSALVGLTIGQYAALHIKHRLARHNINRLDNGLGGVLNIVTLLLSVWLMASLASNLPYTGLRTELRDSRIIGGLNRALPPAPNVIANLGHLISPNGFPDVFIGSEPVPKTQPNLPSLGDLQAAVDKDRASVVRIRGQGCGGIVSGSGFVVGNDLVATNAHVVAGIGHPIVQDANGSHGTSVIWFDPDLDFAVLRVRHLAGHSLALAASEAGAGTPGAVLGYPGGGDFSAGPAVVLDKFKARGRNIYGTDRTLRDIYEVQADIIPGNSGGPLVDKNGQVMGMVFAESTSFNHVGYALTDSQVNAELGQAKSRNQVTGTGQCAQ